MQGRLEDRKGQLYLFHSEVMPVLTALAEIYHIQKIFSHQEIGNALSYKRDKEVKVFCQQEKIAWLETPTNGVIRRLKSRKTWQQRWEETMHREPFLVREDHQTLYLRLELHPENERLSEGGLAGYLGWIILAIPG